MRIIRVIAFQIYHRLEMAKYMRKMYSIDLTRIAIGNSIFLYVYKEPSVLVLNINCYHYLNNVLYCFVQRIFDT